MSAINAMTFTHDDIKRLVPEDPDGIQAWIGSHLASHRKVAKALLTTRRQLEIAMEGLKAMRDCPDYHIEDICEDALESIKELNHG